jgi:hypothetical protein
VRDAIARDRSRDERTEFGAALGAGKAPRHQFFEVYAFSHDQDGLVYVRLGMGGGSHEQFIPQ